MNAYFEMDMKPSDAVRAEIGQLQTHIRDQAPAEQEQKVGTDKTAEDAEQMEPAGARVSREAPSPATALSGAGESKEDTGEGAFIRRLAADDNDIDNLSMSYFGQMTPRVSLNQRETQQGQAFSSMITPETTSGAGRTLSKSTSPITLAQMEFFERLVDAPGELRLKNLRARGDEKAKGMTKDQIIRSRLKQYLAGDTKAISQKDLLKIYTLSV